MLGVEGTMSGTRIVGTASATKRREVTISLPHSGWADGEQTVAVSGMTAAGQTASRNTAAMVLPAPPRGRELWRSPPNGSRTET